jgi:hypothetical protein
MALALAAAPVLILGQPAWPGIDRVTCVRIHVQAHP